MRSSFSKLTQSNKTVSISQVTDSLLKLINDKAAADKDLEEKKIQQQNIELRDKVKRYKESGLAAAERILSR